MYLLVKGLATLGLLYLFTFVYNLARNLYLARKIGLPIIIVPWHQNHFVWMVTSVPLRPFLRRVLPDFIWHRLALTIYGWEWQEKLRPFHEYAAPQGSDKTFVLATCGQFEIWTRDPEISTELLKRPRDFQQPYLTGLFMGQFGHNVLTTDGERWARQRKLVAGVINERVSKVVFDESVQQTRGLLNEMFADESTASVESNRVFDMVKKITIQVLSGAGLGASVSWRNEENEKPKPGFTMTYLEAVQTVVECVGGPIILPSSFCSRYPSWAPGGALIRRLGVAKNEFPRHTAALLEEEKRRTSEKSVGRNNIMSQLLKASEQDSSVGLSDEEMTGNLFIFTAAGFDTTANTISYALAYLCRYPQWQDWLLEEIDEIMPADTDTPLEYTAVYPNAVRVMAVMLETLRLCTPLVHLVKEPTKEQVITTSKVSFTVPANTSIYLELVALHLDPDVWRGLNRKSDPSFASSSDTNDESHFRPSRWLNPAGSTQPLFHPPTGSFLPWSSGPRVCPGQKMAQVEFATVILTLLQRHRVDAAAIGDESRKDIDARLDGEVRDSISILTLQMQGVYDVGDKKGLPVRLSKRR